MSPPQRRCSQTYMCQYRSPLGGTRREPCRNTDVYLYLQIHSSATFIRSSARLEQAIDRNHWHGGTAVTRENICLMFRHVEFAHRHATRSAPCAASPTRRTSSLPSSKAKPSKRCAHGEKMHRAGSVDDVQTAGRHSWNQGTTAVSLPARFTCRWRRLSWTLPFSARWTASLRRTSPTSPGSER